MGRLKAFFGTLSLLIAGALVVLATPQPLFAHQMTYGRFQIWSDRPIDEAAAETVLADAQGRIAKSGLYTADQTFRLFVCNDNWKLALYSQHFTGTVGGVADTWFTRNIYLRRVDWAANQIIPPGGWMYDRADRPLSYYVAHEATHVMESRALGRLAMLSHPQWMNEGYADYVGKAGQFDQAANLALLRAGDPKLDYAKSGLYRRFHLEVAYELDHRRLTAKQLFALKTPEAKVLADLSADPTFR